jgi:arsenite methyltransferase
MGEYMENKNLKEIVKEKYSEIVLAGGESVYGGSCCGTQCGCTPDYTTFSDDYTKLKGYNPDADLKLGCGVPTEFAQIKIGDTVLDLGSGAGNDAFVARALVGETGQVLGVDMTEAMVEKAQKNAKALNFANVEFRLGDIEEMPVEDDSVDVVISNCVLNLVPDKQKAFSEIFRVLKSGAHFSVSDVVLTRTLPEALKNAVEMYAGCVSGAVLKDEYLKIIDDNGFVNAKVLSEKAIAVPTDVLSQYLNDEQLKEITNQGSPIVSVTVYADKP